MSSEKMVEFGDRLRAAVLALNGELGTDYVIEFEPTANKTPAFTVKENDNDKINRKFVSAGYRYGFPGVEWRNKSFTYKGETWRIVDVRLTCDRGSRGKGLTIRNNSGRECVCSVAFVKQGKFI